MSLLTDPFRHHWDYYKECPCGRLVRLFVERIFRGGGDTDTEGLDLGIGLVLTLLAMPGGFVSILLFNKYGSLLQWLRGQKNVDTLSIAFPDEYFFIVLSMTVTGAIAVWRWDSIFPDRRDYINLVHLPISTRTIFLANSLSVLFLVGLVAIDVNAASCVLFPTVVSAAQSQFLFFVKFAVVHAVGVVLSSVFVFFAVFSVLGLLMAVLPPQMFRRISAYVRGIVLVYLVAILCTSFMVPDLLRRARGPAPAWSLLMPSCWFVGLCQWLRGRASPALTELAKLCLPGLALVVLFALCMFVIGYRKYFVRIAEMAEGAAEYHRGRGSRIGLLLDRFLLMSPFQKATFRFVGKTLFRSEAHRLVLTGVAGLALVLASQALMTGYEESGSVRNAAMSADALSIPLILTFLLIVGLRLVFEIPVELRANWVFRLMVDADRQESQPLARKVILMLLLPWIAVITFAAYLYLEGVWIALLHTAVVVIWTVLLTNVVLVRFRKIPFTCSMPVFKQHSIVILIAFCFGFLIYVGSTAEFESSALRQPLRMLELVPVAAVAWYIPRHLKGSTIDLEKKLIFEESATRSFELLGLGE